MLAPVAGRWLGALVTAQPPACRRTDGQGCHQTAVQPTPTPLALTPPYGSPPAPSHVPASPPSLGTAAPWGSETVPAIASLPTKPQGCSNGGPAPPRGALKEARQPGTPVHPHASTGADSGQDPQHLPQLRSRLGAAWAGRGGRHLGCICSGYRQRRRSPGKTTHPCWLRHHRHPARWFKSPLTKKQRLLCRLSWPRPPQSHGGQPQAASRPGREQGPK